MKINHIPSLNGLRAICIGMVISDHLILHKFIARTRLAKIFGLIFFNGGLGVNFFFLISGFLITRLLINENGKSGTVSLKRFYLHRILRIFPAYYLLLTVYFLLQSFGYIHLTLLNWISDLTYTNQFVPDNPPETLHLWSLSVEELFYLLWPLLYLKFFSKSSPLYLYGLILLFSILRFSNCDYPHFFYSNTIVNTGDALLIGCLSAIHYKSISQWVLNHNKLVLLAFPLLVLLVFSEVYVYHLISIREFPADQLFFIKFLLPLLDSLCGYKGLFTNIIISIIVIYSINVKNYWYKLLNHKFLNYIGVLSYSIYLWQQIFITERMHMHQVSVPLILIFIIICANISYHFVEKPFLLLKDRVKAIKLFRLKLKKKLLHNTLGEI